MIEIDGKIYRNLEEQVRKNKEDIESIDTNVTSNTNAITSINNRLDNLDITYATDEDLQNLQSQINTKANQSDLNSTDSRVSTLESTITQLSPQVAKALKTPISAPSSTELVAVDTSNGQAMISIGDGLTIENDTLKLSGGQQQQIKIDNDSITKNLEEELQAVKLKNAITNINTTVTKSDFSGATKLSKQQYYELLQYGQIEVDGQVITFSDEEFYITPDLSEDFDSSGITLKTEVCTATSFAGVLDWISDISSKNIYQIEVNASTSISLASVTNRYLINTDGTIAYTPDGGDYFFSAFSGGKTSNITYSDGIVNITFIEGNTRYIIYLNGFGQYQIRYHSISSGNGLRIFNANYNLTQDDFNKLTFTIKYFE